MDNHFRPDNKPENPSNNIESLRAKLAEKVRLNLEQYKDEIKDFSLMTTSKRANGGFPTNEQLPPVQYSSSYDSEYEFYGLPRERGYLQEGKSGYVVDTKNSFYTFVGPLGRALHTPDRPGNGLFITLKGEKGKKLSEELVGSIKDLLDTLVPYEEGEKYEDLKKIIKEALPVIEAFQGLAQRFPSNGRISIPSLIEEYEEALAELDSHA